MLDFMYCLKPIHDKFASQIGKIGHEKVKTLPKSGATHRVLILIDKDGMPGHGVYINDEMRANFHLYQFHAKRVAFRFRLAKSFNEKQLEKIANGSCKEIISSISAATLTGIIDDDIRSPISDLVVLVSKKLPPTHPLFDLNSRLSKSSSLPQLFFENLFREAASLIKRNAQKKFDQPVVEQLIDISSIDFVFDVYDESHRGKGVQADSSFERLIKSLREIDQKDNGSLIDIFGNAGTIASDPFGKVNNRYPLFQRNEQTFAYKSYGLNSVDACPLTIATRLAIDDVASWVTSEGNKNKFWIGRSENTGKRSIETLTVIMPDTDNKNDFDEVSSIVMPAFTFEPLLALIRKAEEGAKQKEPGANGEKPLKASLPEYVDNAAEITKVLRGIISRNNPMSFRGFFARKVGDSAFCAEQIFPFSAKDLEKAVENWARACSISVKRRFFIIIDGELKKEYRTTDCYPLDITTILNRHWTTGTGVAHNAVIKHYLDNITFQSFTQNDMLRLFLYDDKKVAQRIIREIAAHHLWLMIDVARRDMRKEPLLLYGGREDALRIPSILSLALQKEGQTMEHENELGFVIGQTLGVIDWLHVEWCRATKHQNLPSKLRGSSLLPIFLRTGKLDRKIIHLTRNASYLRNWAQRIAFKKDNDQTEKDIVAKNNWLSSLIAKMPGQDQTCPPLDEKNCALVGLGYFSIYPNRSPVTKA